VSNLDGWKKSPDLNQSLVGQDDGFLPGSYGQDRGEVLVEDLPLGQGAEILEPTDPLMPDG
jgi:hypothetical protein